MERSGRGDFAVDKKTIWQKEWVLPFGFASLACLILLATNILDSYGIFRDEYYFIACSRHLALGYVDQPPLSIPILPVRAYIGYTKALGITQKSSEAHQLNELPQSIADRFGWEDLAKTVSAAYQTLPENERSKTIIYARNYGEAGAIDYFRGKYDLPPVVCPHNSCWFWGWAYA